MRTTLDLDDDVLEPTRALAEQRRQSLDETVSYLVRTALAGLPKTHMSEGGYPVFSKRGGPPVTDDFVNQLRDELGV